MKKISGPQVAQLLQTVPIMLRSLAAERDEAITKLASAEQELAQFRQRDRVHTIAGTAHQRGLHQLGANVQDKVAAINTALEQGKSLEVMEQAVDMSSPNGSLGGLDKTSSADLGGGEISRQSGEALLSYIQS